MRNIASILVLLVLLAQLNLGVSMTTEVTPESQYRMVLSGLQSEIDRICGYGDCDLTFPTQWEATNYFYSLYS